MEVVLFVIFFAWLVGKWLKKQPTDIFNLSDDCFPSIEYNDVDKKSTHYTPQSFDEYIGQHKAKTLLQSYIKGVIARKKQPPHLLISGLPGCGKTTLARIFAKEFANARRVNTHYYECIATTIPTIEFFVNAIRQLDGGIFVLDECHALERMVVEKMYTILTDFSFNGQALTPFTLIGCTTEYGEMIEKCEPFVQRFPLQVQLDGYTEDDIIKILRQLKAHEFNDLTGDCESIYKIISRNARNTPRTAISYLRSTYYLDGNVQSALYNQNVLDNGYTKDDLKILECISKSNIVGIQAICSFLGTSNKNYLNKEAFLFKNGLISRTPRGRTLTDEGRAMLNKLKEKIPIDISN
jgi:Holliday junction DNA helicase RuvB